MQSKSLEMIKLVLRLWPEIHVTASEMIVHKAVCLDSKILEYILMLMELMIMDLLRGHMQLIVDNCRIVNYQGKERILILKRKMMEITQELSLQMEIMNKSLNG